uniref:BRCT domain-containing protein n=1 Tax=Davidia involucrata TaxID=16924 RepID=A0A5B6Z966_DAVIN
MGSLGDGDDEMKPIKRSSAVDLSDTETQPFDSQFSPPSLSGEKFKGEDVNDLQLLQSTELFEDTVLLEDAFETQVMNLAGETQILDDTDCIMNEGTQLLDGCNNEVTVNSDGEGTDRTEVLGDTEELSDDDSVKGVGNCPLDLGDMVYTSLCKQGDMGYKVESDEFSYERQSSGPVRRGFTSVRAASLRASGLAARSKASKVINNGSRSIRSDSQSLKEHIAEDDGVPVVRDSANFREEIDQDHVMGEYNEQMNGRRNESKCRIGSSIVRKLFMEDAFAEIKGHNDYINNTGGEADLPQLLTCNNELAGLSYVNSQEPGESSQANALDFVDRFLNFSVIEFDQEIDFRKSTGEKKKHVSSAKGTQSLAKICNLKSTVGERGTFDWDDSREDEGGGEFFSRKKEAFFDNDVQRRRSFTQHRKPQHLNSKGSGAVNGSRDKEERLDIHDKIIGLDHSDLRLVLHNPKWKDTTTQVTETKFRKNLIKELDEQLNIDSSDGREATGTDKDMEDMLNVGFDTQMAAEAMGALCHGVDVTDNDFNDANQGAKNMYKSYPKGETKNRAHSKKDSLKKRSSSSDCGVITRKSKKTKRIVTKLSKESSVSLQKQVKNAKKQRDLEVVKAEPKRVQSYAEVHFATNVSENLDKITSKVVNHRKEERALKRSDIDNVDNCHVAASSSGLISAKKPCLQEQLGTFIPIAYRTRQCRVANQLKPVGNATNDRAEINYLTEVGALKGKRKSCWTGFDSFEVLNPKEKSFELGSNQSGELENVKLTGHDQSNPKIAGKTIVKIDELSYPSGRRTQRKVSGQLDGTGNLRGSSNQSVGQEANGQSIAKLKWSKTNSISTCMDLGIKRKTRSSACAGSVLQALDTQSKQRSFQQSVDKVGSGDAALNCNSVAINGSEIPKDVGGVQASKRTDGKSDEDTTLSAEGAGVKARLEASPREGCKQSGSACATPANCRTPINAASPICMGDEYLKQSCRKNLSRSSLMKEINSLIANGPEPTSALKDTRRRRDMANVHVLFSHHLDEDIIKQQKKILARLGASVASSISDATHFITDKFVRTRNMLEAIAFGKPVVTHLWLESCGQASCFIDEKNYILRDAKKEKEFGFSLPVSLARACQCPLLRGHKVYITPNTKPGKELLASLVKAVQGLAVERIGRSSLKDDKIPDELLVLSCEEDYAVCVPFLEKGAAVYSSELLLNGIVTQKLEYERHRLFVDHVKRTRSTIWLKKDSNRYLPVTKCN